VATKRERQRQLAREAHQRRMERRADRVRRERQWAVSIVAAVIVLAVGFGAAAIAGVFSTPKSSAAASAGATATASPSVTASPSASASPSATSAMVGGKCIYTAGGTAARKVSLPPATPDAKATYKATITTNRGTIVIDLANSGAPCTVNSFVSLASQKYFNNTPCHRLTTAPSGIYVLQCGDPTGKGTGGPGYAFYTENLASLKPATVSGTTEALYPAGTVAMANSGTADSNGSQFFLVYKNTDLPASYTPFGTIASGLDVIQNVAKAGSTNSSAQGDGAPKEKVQIERVTITKT
jgi:peptidyl-prolyl cis-trans isomerase B (cyclophilin B)